MVDGLQYPLIFVVKLLWQFGLPLLPFAADTAVAHWAPSFRDTVIANIVAA